MQGVIGNLDRPCGNKVFDFRRAVISIEVDVAPVLGGLSLGDFDDEDVLESDSFRDEVGESFSRGRHLVSGRTAPEIRDRGNVVGIEDDALWSQ